MLKEVDGLCCFPDDTALTFAHKGFKEGDESFDRHGECSEVHGGTISDVPCAEPGTLQDGSLTCKGLEDRR